MAAAFPKLPWSRRDPAREAALARVREWTRARFTLAADAAVLVAEIACTAPGCPPHETVVVFWVGETRHRFRVFKPASDVTIEDVPPAFLRNALAAADGFECGCC